MFVGGIHFYVEQVDVKPALLLAIRQGTRCFNPRSASLDASSCAKIAANARPRQRRHAPPSHGHRPMSRDAEEVRPVLDLIGIPLHDGFRHARMESLAAAAEQGFVGRLLHQCVLERVSRGGWCASLKHQFRANQFREPGFQGSGRLSNDIAEHLLAELAADNRADLRQLTPVLQPIQTCQQRIRKACGDVSTCVGRGAISFWQLIVPEVALVISSMNRGTPSARVTICSCNSDDSARCCCLRREQRRVPSVEPTQSHQAHARDGQTRPA